MEKQQPITAKIGKKIANLVRCPTCQTEYWRTKELLGKKENCGVCLKNNIFEICTK